MYRQAHHRQQGEGYTDYIIKKNELHNDTQDRLSYRIINGSDWHYSATDFRNNIGGNRIRLFFGHAEDEYY